jgi:hypothetical protein
MCGPTLPDILHPKSFVASRKKLGGLFPLSPPITSLHLSPTPPSTKLSHPMKTLHGPLRFSCCTSYRTAMQQNPLRSQSQTNHFLAPVMREGSVGDTGTPSTRCDFAMCNKRTGCVTCAWKMREERRGLVDGEEGRVLLHVAICMIMAAHKFWHCLLGALTDIKWSSILTRIYSPGYNQSLPSSWNTLGSHVSVWLYSLL